MADIFDRVDPLDPEDISREHVSAAQAQEERVAEAQQVLRNRREAYIRFFGGTGREGDRTVVMSDLRKFCRGGQTAWADDARLHALLTGRQEVYQRIQDHLELSFDEMWERYS